MTTHHGDCACTSISWASTSPPTSLDFCHCTQCQRISGAPFISWLAFPISAISWRGTDNISTTRLLISDGMDSIAARSFCSGCGSTLTMQYDCYKGHRVHVAAGTMVEGKVGVEVERAHIFLRDKPEWWSVPEDGVRRWEGFPESFLEALREFEQRELKEEGAGTVEERETSREVFEEDSEDDEMVIRRAEEKAREEEGVDGGESDEELRKLQRRFGGGGGSGRKEMDVEEYMYDSD